VPLPADNHTAGRQSFWPSIARIFVVEILVLLGLSVAVVTYLNWSSEVAWAEFLAASKLAAPAPGPPIQPAKGQNPCGRSA
jgi:hypothetical protein